MFLAVHALIGAVAGNAVNNPIAAFSLGFISHFFTDMIPHGDMHVYENYKRGAPTFMKKLFPYLYVGGDALLTILLVSLVFIKQDFFHPVNVALGILGGLLPDLMAGIVEALQPKKRTWLNRKLAWFHGFHMLNHNFLIKHARNEKDIPLRYGLMLQGLSLAVLLKVIL